MSVSSRANQTRYVWEYICDNNLLHKYISGDARGRIFSWSVTEQPGRGVADHWLKDEGADQCVKCYVK